MSMERIKKFVEEYKVNSELRAKLNSIKSEDEAALIKAVNEAGFDLTVEDFREYTKMESEVGAEKLSDEELDNVSAGSLFNIDLCPKRFDQLLCKVLCPLVRTRRSYSKGGSVEITYSYCVKKYWDEETNIGF